MPSDVTHDSAEPEHALVRQTKAKVGCVIASDSCIASEATATQRNAIMAALQENPVKLCDGERVIIVGKPSLMIRTTGIKRSALQHFLYALQGSFGKTTFSGEIEIRCKK